MLRYCYYFLSFLTFVCVYFIFIQESIDNEKTSTILPFQRQKIDSSCILANVIKRKENNNPDRITLVLHASSDRIDEEIVEQIENWNAPVSLAIAFYEKNTIETIGCVSSLLRDLKNQSLKVDEFLSVHFLIENANIDCNRLALKAAEPCFQSNLPKNENLTAFEISTKLIKYPINKARNLGLQYSSTKFILVADLGHYFSQNFEKKMRTLANSVLEKSPKTALVYRIFETETNATQPKTKTNLKNLMESNEAFEFHHTFNDHSIQNLSEWFETPESSDSTSIQFFKDYNSAKWEPQFVSLKNIPLFDTGFRYPRRDNTVLRWEMCRAGYKFAIINDVFAFHKGLKSYTEMNFLNRVRRRLIKTTEEAFGRFSERMDLQYPKTRNKCPLITAKSNI
uniref:Uncharacterized protein n=1 Tax=Panagrolaimus sp. PS1159 TaxID=55785 RepID=A0AC35FAF5_9BILA